MKTSQYLYLTIAILGTFFSFDLYAKDFYKWVDANGSTHYTLKSPTNSIKKVTKVTTYNERKNTEKSSDQSENISSTTSKKNEIEIVGDTFTIATSNGILEIPPLKDGESITFNKNGLQGN